jgi:sugar fermentation stimulation protein A
VARRPSAPLSADVAGRFVRRYKRFLADVETDAGTLTVHCANPGSMKGFHRPGAAVRCSTSDDPKRKLRHTLEMMRVGRTWVGLHTGRANELVARALAAGLPRGLAGYAEIRREVSTAHGELSARLDFHLSGHARARDAWVEVKSVTLADRDTARFPDSVTLRGRRHADLLRELCTAGSRAALVFLVQRADCERVAPADDIDPDYGQALRRAAAAGVEVYALGARVTSRAIRIERELPVLL